ncbi:hypothetical protein CYLTODRAFT_423293 [Cylindrobasidium torrendii FP15055 ss-10]|uniref:F-box domain-containing protein n=1 Tax=Cylindrobasidium torrendii FP15055 ss-10 TaxID=1314674 RepID=A0A0D7BAM8_9AGAR|nr:hypothetical protein CYLTODRAFT_423293 [Cylindrobasidium torrendii FP15055 ss-10]
MGTAELWSLCYGEQCTCPNHRLLATATHPDEEVLPNDPLLEFLETSNEQPLEDVRPGLNSLLSSLKNKKAARDALAKQLRSAMVEFKAALTTLDSERAQLKTAITRGENAFSPVKRIPVEILQHIFQYAITFPPGMPYGCHENTGASDDSENEYPKFALWHNLPEPKDPLRTLKQVSRRWRAAVLGSTALHSWLSIHMSHIAKSTYEALLQQHLASSGDKPLSIAVTCELAHVKSLARHGYRLRDVLKPYATRIVELQVFLPDSIARELWGLQLPSLSSLLMHNTPRPRNPSSSWSLLKDCPLRRLVLYNYASPINCVADASSRTWEHIVHLELLSTPNETMPTGPSVECMLEVLSLTLQLRVAVLHVEQSDHDWPVAHVVCPQLMTLTIGRHNPTESRYELDPLQRLIDNITFPMLESLSIELTDGPGGLFYCPVEAPASVFASVVTAIERSSAPLVDFEYSHGAFDDADIHRLFEVAEDLDILAVRSISNPSGALRFVNALIPKEEFVPLPLLRTLCLSGRFMAHGNEHAMEEAVIALACRRWDADALQILDIEMEDRVDWRTEYDGKSAADNARAVIKKGIRECVAQGLCYYT